MTANPPIPNERAAELFRGAELTIYQRTDRMFAWLMIFQWLGGIVAASWISPKTWIGAASEVNMHVWAAVFLGGAIASFPVYLAWKQPGHAITRQVIAAAQMLFSALLIHLTGGRIETHFHVFGSLAFLAFYRDAKVIVTATVIIALDHFVRGTFWPESVFGVFTVNHWRWLEHAGWVLFEDVFLVLSIKQGRAEMLAVAERQASLEDINASIERQVADRTSELRESQALYLSLVEQLPAGVFRKDAEGRYVLVNSWLCRLHGISPDEFLGKTPQELSADEVFKATGKRPEFATLFNAGTGHHRSIMDTGVSIEVEEHHPKNKGRMEYVHVVKSPVQGADGKIIGSQGVLLDITQRKLTEQKLSQLHKQLVDASRQAGMAEIATSVLHNVGNVLNSVNVSGSLIAEKLRDSKINNVNKLAALFTEHQNDLGNFLTEDPKGKKVPGFLSSLAANLETERGEVLREIDSLSNSITHIREIVSVQQNYARSLGIIESLKVTELVDDAVRMNNGAMCRHQINLVREYSDIPAIQTDRHKVLQILVNLIRNAKYACDDSGRDDKQITLRVANGDGTIKISVIDNGIGIPPENLTRIFNHGFTTRKDGHGFGLHSGALAAKEMGGDLVAASPGKEQGATFTLILPVNYKRNDL